MNMLLRKLFLFLVAIVNYRCTGELSDKISNRDNEISSGQLMEEFKIPNDFKDPSVVDYDRASVIVMKGMQMESFPLSSLDTTLSTSKLYDTALKTVIYFPGWNATPDDKFALKLKQAFEILGGYNFLFVDWTSYGSKFYLRVGNNLSKVENMYGEKFAAMIKGGLLSLDKWHFIGLSLGAHVAGGTARIIRSMTKSVVPRITGLDPTGPLIYPPCPLMGFYRGLRDSDADFVDVIHTDEWRAGTTFEAGHVDFWLNVDTGVVEPGCPPIKRVSIIDVIFATGKGDENGCSHVRSVDYFIESITMNPRKTAFAAVKCISPQLNFVGNLCSQFSNTTSNFMGLHATKIPSGNFFLKTNGESPFSLS